MRSTFPPSPQDDEVAEVIGLIKHHEQEIVSLRKRLNLLLPTSCIPDDVLVEVFRHSIHMVRESYWRWKSGHPSLDNLMEDIECPKKLRSWTVPLVCHRWRNLAMNNPSLWSLITSIEHDYEWNAFQHSMSADLRLNLVAQYFNEDSLFCHLLKQLPRTYWLEYSFDVWNFYHGDHIYTPNAFDKIRTLHLWCHRDSIPKAIPAEDQLLHSLSEAPLPRLTFLTLEYVPTTAYFMFVRPTITSLEIVNDHYRHVGQLEVGPLLSILSDLPLLKVLRLRFPYHTELKEDLSGSNLTDVHLSHLEELDLTTQRDATVLVLSHLSFPLNANVSVSIIGAWVALLPSLSWGLSTLSFVMDTSTRSPSVVDQIMKQLASLCLSHSSLPYRLSITDEAKDENLERIGWDVQIRISYRTGHSLTLRVLLAHLERIISYFPLQKVEEVEIRNSIRALEVPESAGHWTRTIPASTVIFTGLANPFASFLKSLTPQGPQDGRADPGIVFPNLVSLVAFDIEGETDEHFVPHNFGEILCDILRSRVEAGAPIKEFSWNQNMGRISMFCSWEVDNLQARLKEIGVKSEFNIPVG